MHVEPVNEGATLMNSEAIKQKHHQVYESLETDATYWASAPGVFFWGGEHAVLHGGPAICQKVPLRVWIWFHRREPDGGPRIRLSSNPECHQVYQGWANRWQGGFSELGSESEQRFTEWTKVQQAVAVVASKAEENGLNDYYEVKSLHELSPGSGVNWSGAFSAALVACLLMATGDLTPDQVRGWPAEEVSSEADLSGIVAFHRLAWQVESVFHGGAERASGYGTLCSIVRTPGPVLYVTSERWLSGAVRQGANSDNAGASEMPPVGMRAPETPPFALQSLASVGNPPPGDQVLQELPIVYGLVDSGLSKSTEERVESTESLGARLQELLEGQAGALLGVTALAEVLKNNLRLGGIVDGSVKGRDLHHEQFLSLGTSALRVLGELLDLLQAHAQHHQQEVDKAISALADAVRRTQGGLVNLGLDRDLHGEADEITHVAGAVYRWARSHQRTRTTAVKMTGGGGGGMILFVTDKRGDDVKSTLQAALGAMRSDLENKRIGVYWTSAQDGLDYAGLQVHAEPESTPQPDPWR